jgi:2-dehydropantoate 2-reductase
MREKPRIAVVGVGAIGSLIAASLNKASVFPYLIFRRREEVLEVKNAGINLYVDEMPHSVKGIISTYDDLQDSSLDIAFICTKAYDVPAALSKIKRKLKAGSLAVMCQNGLGSLETAKKILSHSKVIPLIVNCGVRAEGEKTYRLVGCSRSFIPYVHIPYYDDVLRGLSLLSPVEIGENEVEPYRWLKLAVNAAINPITAINMVTNSEVVEDPYLRELAFDAVREVEKVAKAYSIKLPVDPVDEMVRVAKSTGKNISSMLQDILNGVRSS